MNNLPQAYEFDDPGMWYRAWCEHKRREDPIANVHAASMGELASIAGVHQQHYRRIIIKSGNHPGPVNAGMRRKLYPVRKVMEFLFRPEEW